MRFLLIDRIVDLVPGERIVAVKAVAASEEYLADHFPSFAVLPGVLMLEAMTEAAGWLVRASLDFPPLLTLLGSAKNITYKSFVRPGHLLEVTVECRRLDREGSEFSGIGVCDGREAVKGRFSLSHVPLDSVTALGKAGQQQMLLALRDRFAALCQGVLESLTARAGRA